MERVKEGRRTGEEGERNDHDYCIYYINVCLKTGTPL